MKHYNYSTILLLLLCTGYAKAQLPEDGDKNWNLIFVDNFSYSNWNYFQNHVHGKIWNTGLWGTSYGDTAYETEYSGNDDGGHNFHFDSTIIIGTDTTTFMSLVTRKDSPQYSGSYADSTGTHSRMYNFTHVDITSMALWQHGYFEVRMRMMDLTQNRKGAGTAGWMFGGRPSDKSTPACKSEIDIYECQAQIHNQTTHTCDVHYADTINCNNSLSAFQQNYGADQTPIDFSSHQFHTIGALWAPDHVDFYIDGQYLKSVTQSNFPSLTGFPNLSKMFLVLGGGVGGYTHYAQQSSQVTDSTIFPYYHDVDYVKVWQLDMDSCSSGTTTLNKLDENTYPYGVKHDIHITGNALTVITSGHNIVLRASNGIQIDKNFNALTGATFEMIPTPCESH